MISKKLQDAINAQINKELFSEYLYISMQAWFANQNLDGFANWMDAQGKEERFHAMKFFNYLIERGGKVELKALEGPHRGFQKPAGDLQGRPETRTIHLQKHQRPHGTGHQGKGSFCPWLAAVVCG